MYNKNSRTVAVVSYITWIGWIVAFLIRDRSDAFAAHHINQALMINLISIAGGLCSYIPQVGDQLSTVVSIGVLVLTIMGIYRAAKWRQDPLPLVGGLRLI